MSRNCKACTLMEPVKKSDPLHFEIWHADHICSLNYRGSVPNMEKTGAVNIFQR